MQSREEHYSLFEVWKSIGGASDSVANCPESGTEFVGYDLLKELVSEERACNPYDFHEMFPSSTMRAKDPLRIMYESCLHVPSTEADCERFFRLLSLVTDKKYQVNILSSKACRMAFVKYYAEEIYYSMGSGREVNETVYQIFLHHEA